jgi:hypothetical protein
MKKTFKHKRIRLVERIRRAIFSLFINEIMEVVTPHINQQDFYVTKTLEFERLVSEFSVFNHSHLTDQMSFEKRELARKAVDFILTETSSNYGIHTQKDVKLTLFIGKPKQV